MATQLTVQLVYVCWCAARCLLFWFYFFSTLLTNIPFNICIIIFAFWILHNFFLFFSSSSIYFVIGLFVLAWRSLFVLIELQYIVNRALNLIPKVMSIGFFFLDLFDFHFVTRFNFIIFYDDGNINSARASLSILTLVTANFVSRFHWIGWILRMDCFLLFFLLCATQTLH